MAYSKHKVSGRLLQLRHQGFVRSVVSGWYERTWSEARMFHWRRH
jgi:hypothetical protein